MVCGPVPAQYRGMKPLTLAAMFTVLSLADAGAAPNQETSQHASNPEKAGITLLVHDFAKLRDSEQASTHKKLVQIMDAAGIHLNWVACRRGNELVNEDRCGHLQRGDLFLQIVNGQTVKGSRLALDYLGLAEPGWGGRGLITVMVNNVRDLARGTLWQFPDLLAHATAHEIGHLLGIVEHSTSGIMRADWRKEAIKHMRHAALVFSHSEATRMQQAARLRTAPDLARAK
jgi:hypothetical protein